MGKKDCASLTTPMNHVSSADLLEFKVAATHHESSSSSGSETDKEKLLLTGPSDFLPDAKHSYRYGKVSSILNL